MSEVTIPGDRIASIEEYGAGDNTFDDGDSVRSTIAGKVIHDKKERTVSVAEHRQISPRPGDIVIGTVAAVMSSMIAVSIDYINGTRTKAGIECICSLRNFRKRTVALANDIVMLKITSLNNGTLHASISEPELGVILTKCRKCGGDVMLHRDVIKCKDCSWIDERELSNRFGQTDLFD